jgi:hypothetical protein
MANTTTLTGSTVTITLDGSTNWVWSSELPFPDGVRLKWILFHPSAANDVLVIREASTSGAEIFRVKCSADTDDRVLYYKGAFLRPVIKAADCTLGTAANARVTMELC